MISSMKIFDVHSPHFEVDPLAEGDGAEGPITHFQDNVLEIVHIRISVGVLD